MFRYAQFFTAVFRTKDKILLICSLFCQICLGLVLSIDLHKPTLWNVDSFVGSNYENSQILFCGKRRTFDQNAPLQLDPLGHLKLLLKESK